MPPAHSARSAARFFLPLNFPGLGGVGDCLPASDRSGFNLHPLSP
jgi:hypothetical protein